MKMLVCAFAVFVVACLAEEQSFAQHEDHTDSTTSPVSLEVHNNQQERILTARLGPVSLVAHAGHVTPQNLFLTVPFDGWFTGYTVKLLDDGGATLPPQLLHHLNLFNTARRHFACPETIEEIFFGAASELVQWPEVPGVGYPVARGQIIRIRTMFHNPTNVSHSKTYLEVRIKYRPREADQGLQSVNVVWFSVKGCGPTEYDLKPGASETSQEFTISRTGKLLGIGGHMHDYGRELKLENVTRGEMVATLQTKLNAEGRLISVPIVFFTENGGYRLNRGEVVKVTAIYDNPTSKLVPEGAMGIAIGYFVPDEE